MLRIAVPRFAPVGPRDRVRGRYAEVRLTRAVAAHLGDEEVFLPVGTYRGEYLYRLLGPTTYRTLLRDRVLVATGKMLA